MYQSHPLDSRTARFYAPWCGHCQNLKPAYESAAKSLAGIAKVAAVNCDDEVNKPFCGQMGVQGFPTLKIVRPGKKPGKPIVEDYQGPRAAKGIVEAVKDKIPNSVKRVTDKNLDEWLVVDKDSPKAILFSDKSAISATLRTLAIDFAGLVAMAQIKKTETKAVEKFSVSEYPTLVLLPGGDKDPIKFDGEVKKDSLVEFLSQVAPPNADCPPPKAKKSKGDRKDEKKASKSSSKFAKASASHKSADASSAVTSAASQTVDEPVKPSDSPKPNSKDEKTPEPIVIPEQEAKPTIPVITDSSELQYSCLTKKSTTCILAILPKNEASESATSALASLAAIHSKHDKLKGHLFPFIAIPASNPLASSFLTDLKLGSDAEIHLVATNGKRSWVKKYSGKTFGSVEVEQWVDAIRMGEGKKEVLPESLIADRDGPGDKEEKVVEQEPIQLEVDEIVEDEARGEGPHDEL